MKWYIHIRKHSVDHLQIYLWCIFTSTLLFFLFLAVSSGTLLREMKYSHRYFYYWKTLQTLGIVILMNLQINKSVSDFINWGNSNLNFYLDIIEKDKIWIVIYILKYWKWYHHPQKTPLMWELMLCYPTYTFFFWTLEKAST